MQLSEMSFSDATPIDSYGPGFFRVGGAIIEGGALIHRDGASVWQGLDDSAALVALAGKIDVVLLGMGDEIAPVPSALREALQEVGIGIEPMKTPTACRTYNVLLAEGRRVAAALVPMPVES
ncbi:Mth938-like domain-containing protein [Shimia biformata]|uniref:Mth938-like domain-containing protein n=1 Tax=Shimia biformata TaxID=1294299 RepID=UPI0019511629|nr:Mth938-like domain-containing protein [Shimia biformata]